MRDTDMALVFCGGQRREKIQRGCQVVEHSCLDGSVPGEGGAMSCKSFHTALFHLVPMVTLHVGNEAHVRTVNVGDKEKLLTSRG